MVHRHLIIDSINTYFFCIKFFIHFHISNNKSIRLTFSYNIRQDILTFAITEFSDTFTKKMNRDDVSFKSQYILEKLVHIDKGFTFITIRDLNNKVTGIVWMTSYMKDNFERFRNYLFIDVMRSSVSNAKEFCYIAPVVLHKIGRINVVCEGFVITESYDAYTFILEPLF